MSRDYRSLTIQERAEGIATVSQVIADIVGSARLLRWARSSPPIRTQLVEEAIRVWSHPDGRLRFGLGRSYPLSAATVCTNRKRFEHRSIHSNANECEAAVGDSLCESLCQRAANELRTTLRKLEHHSDPAFNVERVVHSSLKWLRRELGFLLLRTRLLEEESARSEGAQERSRLQASSQTAQALSLAELFHKYPWLERFTLQRTHQWRHYVQQILLDLRRDWISIESELFDSASPHSLEELSLGLGDSHNNGKTVSSLLFSDGRRCIYKPRTLGMDIHFNDLLGWFSEASTIGMYSPKIVDCVTHGWVEDVTVDSGCSTTVEVERYYHRIGYLTVLLYSLNATDIHYENLVAHSEYPVLVDSETLLSPSPDSVLGVKQPSTLEAVLFGPVSRTGLLPTFGIKGDVLADIAGITGCRPGFDEAISLGITQEGDGAMRVSEQRRSLSPGRNIPLLNGSKVVPTDYLPCILKGVDEAARIVSENRSLLLRKGGLIDRFAKDSIRFMPRSTKRYARARFDLYHPEILADGVEQLRVFAPMTHIANFRVLLRSEMEQLQSQDIPYFFLTASDTGLRTDRGEYFPDMLSEAPIDGVRKKLQTFSLDQVPALKWEIASGFPSVAGESHNRIVRTDVDSLRDRTLPVVEKLVSDLCHVVQPTPNGVECFGYRAFGTRWIVASVGPSLFEGLSGIALALAYCGELLGLTSARQRAQRIARFLCDGIDDIADGQAVQDVGAFSGLGGLIYVLTHLGSLWGDQQYLAHAVRIADCLPKRLKSGSSLDVMSGCAGAIKPLLALNMATGKARLLDYAVSCGTRIAHCQIEQSEENPPIVSDGSAAHGSSGLAWGISALVPLDSSFQAVVDELLAHKVSDDRHTKEPSINRGNNQSDRMHVGDPKASERGWCRGAAGIGLQQLDLLQPFYPSVGDCPTPHSLSNILASVATAEPTRSQCLCHGELGELLFIQSAHGIRTPFQTERMLDRATQLVRSLETGKMDLGAPGGVTVPGLMLGIAGVAIGLLRLCHETRVPNILLLDPPHGSSLEPAT